MERRAESTTCWGSGPHTAGHWLRQSVLCCSPLLVAMPSDRHNVSLMLCQHAHKPTITHPLVLSSAHLHYRQPVSVAIEADQRAFQLYMGGVFDDEECGEQLDHGVLVRDAGAED